MKTLDCIGDMCPIPIMRLETIIQKREDESGPILLITDHSCSQQNISDYCLTKNLTFEVEEVEIGIWEFTIFL